MPQQPPQSPEPNSPSPQVPPMTWEKFTPPTPVPTPQEPVKISKIEANQPRQRRAQRIMETPKVSEEQARRFAWLDRKAMLWVGLVLVLLLSLFSYLALRETRLLVTIQASDVALLPESYVVYDFSERIELIKRNLEARRHPIQLILEENLASLASAEADLAGHVQRRNMILANIEKDEAEIPAMLQRSREELNLMWEEETARKQENYTQTIAKFNQQIQERAKQLGVPFQPHPEVDVPEVTVNAFRLALYQAPSGVNVTQERQWAEGLLQQWREQEKTWEEEKLTIKNKAERMRDPIGTMIEQIQKRAGFLQEQAQDVEDDMALIKEEISRFEGRVEEQRKEIQELLQPFYEELLRTPMDYSNAIFPVQNLGLIDVRELDKDTRFPPGTYRLLVRGIKDNSEYWAIKEFTLQSYRTTRLLITADDFKSVRSLLEQD